MHKDLSLFHREPSRFADYALLDPVVWAPSIEAWVSADPATIREILLSPDFEIIDFRAIYATLSDRFGIDFKPTIQVLDYVALGLSGKEHRDVRKQETLFLKANADAAVMAFCTRLDESLAAVFSGAESGDLALEVVAPSIFAMFSVLSGNSGIDGEDPSLSQVFDRMLSLNRRKKINKQISDLIAAAGSNAEVDDTLMRISFAVVGADTIFASFCQSVLSILVENDGKRMSEIDWPDEMPQTGIPYVDRFAATDVEIDGRQIKAGERVRLYVEAIKNAPDARPSDLFGIGAHICLGKVISMKSWKELVQRLSKINAKVRLLDHEYRKSDFLFNAPAKLQVQISYE